MKKKKMTTKNKEEEKKEDREVVYVDINDLLELGREIVMSGHGGIGHGDIEYVGDIDKLAFSIPKKNRKGKCSSILPPEQIDEYEKGGCGETGGSCICGRPEGHKGDHECELCGEAW